MVDETNHAGLGALKRELAEWVRVHRTNDRQLAIRAELSENTVRRIIQQPAYNPGTDTWRKLADAVGWDLLDVLARAGRAPAGQSPEPWPMIEVALRGLGYSVAQREAICSLIRQIQPEAASASSGG